MRKYESMVAVNLPDYLVKTYLDLKIMDFIKTRKGFNSMAEEENY